MEKNTLWEGRCWRGGKHYAEVGSPDSVVLGEVSSLLRKLLIGQLIRQDREQMLFLHIKNKQTNKNFFVLAV